MTVLSYLVSIIKNIYGLSSLVVGATTLSMMTLNITTLSIALIIMTPFGIATLSKRHSANDTQHNDTLHTNS